MSLPPSSGMPGPSSPAQPPADTGIAALLSQVGGGDRAALSALYQRTAPQVLGLVNLMVGNPAAAEDVTAAVYQQVWHTAARYDPARGSARAWLLSVAHRHAAEHLGAHRGTAVPRAGTAAVELAPLSQLSLPGGLECLDAPSRELILLVYYRGYTAAQAALMLGLPAGTALPRLHAALRTLSPAAITAAPSRAAIGVCARALSTAICLSGADMGNVQIVGPASGVLRIVAQQGFSPAFLDYFSAIDGGTSACGQALQGARPVWVSDVSTSPVFADSEALRVVLEAGVSAVASVPVVDTEGNVRAVISVHSRRRAIWTAEQEQRLEGLALATSRELAPSYP
jgi:RNA polymerase sigma-70 factor (ECF subfamily)